jgi:hypothetical protein
MKIVFTSAIVLVLAPNVENLYQQTTEGYRGVFNR